MDSFSKGRIEQVNPSYFHVVCQCEELPLDGRLLAKRYHNLTQGLDGLHQLYRSCCWNYHMLMDSMDITDCDCVRRRVDRMESALVNDLYFDVNCFVANFISSGVCMTEALRTFATEDLFEGKGALGFGKFVSDLYDSNARYRFTCGLRNYIQHGQLVVSVYKDGDSYKACFDVDQLLNPSHFSIKRPYRELLLHLSVQLDDVRAPFKRIALKSMLVDYYACLQRIYDFFLKTCVVELSARCETFYKMVEAHPECVARHGSAGQIVWYVEGDEMHVLNGIDVSLSGTLQTRRDDMQTELTDAEEINKLIQKKFAV